MEIVTPLLLFHAASTLAMTGLIWFVQVVHYPLFSYAAAGDFGSFAGDHQRRTGWVVMPLMLAEAGAAGLLLYLRPGSAVVWLGGLLLAVIWLATALVQVPLHRRLAAGFDARAARRLVATNWWRTLAWTARSGVALWLLVPGGTP